MLFSYLHFPSGYCMLHKPMHKFVLWEQIKVNIYKIHYNVLIFINPSNFLKSNKRNSQSVSGVIRTQLTEQAALTVDIAAPTRYTVYVTTVMHE